MTNLFAGLLASLGSISGDTASQACVLFIWDEEECPNSLIK